MVKNLAAFFVIGLGMASCGPPAATGQPTLPAAAPSIYSASVTPSTPIPLAQTQVPPFDFNDLLGGLRSNGVEFAPAGEVNIPFFDVKGHLLGVNDSQIQVFEFDDPERAASQLVALEAARTWQRTGTTTPTVEAHIYKKGRIIAVYVGSDGNIMNALTTVMGPQLAGD